MIKTLLKHEVKARAAAKEQKFKIRALTQRLLGEHPAGLWAKGHPGPSRSMRLIAAVRAMRGERITHVTRFSSTQSIAWKEESVGVSTLVPQCI